jgi:hypothetical protein
MEARKKVVEAVLEIYRQQYKYAEPPADFDALMASGETKKKDWFCKYYMDQDEQQMIIVQVCRRYKLTPYERKSVSIEVNLGCSPNTSRKQWLKERKKCQARNSSVKKNKK